MARPKKETGLRKTHQISVRLSDIEYDVISGYAERANMSVAEYVRTQTLKGNVNIEYSIVAAMPELQKLTNEFAAIGNNLNQIARYFNMRDSNEPDEHACMFTRRMPRQPDSEDAVRRGGIRSRAMQEEINACIAKLMEASQAVMQLAGGKYGNLKTHPGAQ